MNDTAVVPLRFDAPAWVHLLLVLSSIATLAAGLFIHFGALMMGMVVLPALIACGLWAATTYRSPRGAELLPWYITAILALLIQGLEQWTYDYPARMVSLFPDLFAAPVLFDQTRFVTVFYLGLTCLLLWGALGLFLRHPLGNYMAWFLALWCLWLPASHVVLVLAGSGSLSYVPGMASAILFVIAGVAGIRRLLKSNVTTGAEA